MKSRGSTFPETLYINIFRMYKGSGEEITLYTSAKNTLSAPCGTAGTSASGIVRFAEVLGDLQPHLGIGMPRNATRKNVVFV